MIYQEYEDDEVIIRLTTVDPQARLEERIEFNHTSGNFLRISFLQYQIDIKIIDMKYNVILFTLQDPSLGQRLEKR